MIELTNEGKLWHYPIDNEQDCDESEASVPFYEHVFLDDYLNEFPQLDVIQEFMTLVLNGLSKNSHLSLSEKREIIFWYRDYFNSHMEIIMEALSAERLVDSKSSQADSSNPAESPAPPSPTETTFTSDEKTLQQ